MRELAQKLLAAILGRDAANPISVEEVQCMLEQGFQEYEESIEEVVEMLHELKQYTITGVRP